MATVIEKQEVRVRPTGAALGADIEGVDLAGALSPGTMAAIEAAWGDHLVLRFRGQSLSDDDLLRFSSQLGELDWAPVAAAKIKVPGEDRYIDGAPEGRRYLMVISNVIENGVAIGQLGAYEAIWHTDMSYTVEPPMASALYSLEVPPSGGDTGFCNMYLALETLPADLRRRVEGKLCRHDASRNSAGELRRGLSTRPMPATPSVSTIRSCAPIRRPATRRCSSAAAATRIFPGCRSASARDCSTRSGSMRPRRIHLVPAMEARRSDYVGQSLRDAPARRFRPGGPASDAPHSGKGRQALLTSSTYWS